MCAPNDLDSVLSVDKCVRRCESTLGGTCVRMGPFIREIYCWYDEPLLSLCALLIVGVFMREGATVPAFLSDYFASALGPVLLLGKLHHQL